MWVTGQVVDLLGVEGCAADAPVQRLYSIGEFRDLLGHGGPAAALIGEGADGGAADFYNGKLCRHEKAIQRDKKNDQENLKYIIPD